MFTNPVPILAPLAAVIWLLVSLTTFIAAHPMLIAAAAALFAGGTYATVRFLHHRTVHVWSGSFRPPGARLAFTGGSR